MPTVHVNLDKRNYPIVVGNEILKDIGDSLQNFEAISKIAIVINPLVASFHLKSVKESLLNKGFKVSVIIVPDGEKFKDYRQLLNIHRKLVQEKLDRRSLIIALGGGVIGDISGFAAATFMRGIRYVQIPTSLLAQVDSSIGGKTGINFLKIKNLIGSFYQPKLVYTDVSLLRTLSQEELHNGLAEVIKYGVIKDAGFFQYLEKNIEKILDLDLSCLEKVVFQCAEIKAKIVQEDEKEKGIRTILNYGHTLGHCFETVSKFSYKHGQAVSLGMVYAGKIAQKIGLLNREDAKKIERLLQKAHLPVSPLKKFNPQEILAILEMDKKRSAGKQKFVLPKKIGQVIIKDDIPIELLKEVLLNAKENNIFS